MARPMILIQEDLLNQLSNRYATGVPICKLIKQYDLPITPPTLTKLISYNLMCDEVSYDIAKIIHNSLFPEWLSSQDKLVLKQSSEWRYIGKMPLGKWEAVI